MRAKPPHCLSKTQCYVIITVWIKHCQAMALPITDFTVLSMSQSSNIQALCVLSAVCCLLSAVCCLLSAVCCLLSAGCWLLAAVWCLLSAVCRTTYSVRRTLTVVYNTPCMCCVMYAVCACCVPCVVCHVMSVIFAVSCLSCRPVCLSVWWGGGAWLQQL